jgi:N-acetylglucosaminyldiphosphoundecaprenol N-acetyl-beta-D-mannosaminyltransferase
MNRHEILGIPVDAVTYRTAVEKVAESVAARKKLWILAINPEKIMKALASASLRRLLLSADLFIPDGIGVLWAGRLLGTPFPERVTGADLLVALVKEASRKGWRVYLLGAAPGVAEQAAALWAGRYPGLKIVGVRYGFFTADEEERVVAEVAAAAPDLLFVAMGSPRQEEFIRNHGERLNVPVCMGVGGSFDVVSGKAKRAPEWMQKTGLEWSYRLLKEPRRILRMAALPRFMLLILRKKLGLLKTEEERS